MHSIGQTIILFAVSVKRRLSVAPVGVPSRLAERGDAGARTRLPPVRGLGTRAGHTDLRCAGCGTSRVGQRHVFLLHREQESHRHQGRLMPSSLFISTTDFILIVLLKPVC